jgi:multidrug efflux pump subunit AcrB
VGSGRPIAVNVDPAELDLTHVDPRDIVTAVQAASARMPAGDGENAATPQDRERRQSVWWYLLLAALLLLAVETMVSNRLSRATS